jgi:hypothetical protein
MADIPLTAKNNCEIDGAFQISATRLSIDESIPLVRKKGNAGVIGIASASGADISFSVTYAVAATGPEVDFNAWKQFDDPHFMVFTEGALRIRCIGVKLGGRSWSSDPGAGNYEKTVKFEATDIVEG